MDLRQARDVAYDWHGGQFSALYRFASTGEIVDRERLKDEIKEALEEVKDESNAEPERLRQLLAYVSTIPGMYDVLEAACVEAFNGGLIRGNRMSACAILIYTSYLEERLTREEFVQLRTDHPWIVTEWEKAK